MDKNLTVIILGSSYIKRRKSHGPTILYKDISGTTILETQIRAIRYHFPNAEIIVVSGLWSDKIASIRKNEFRLVENQLFESTNEVENLRLALNNNTNKNLLIISGNLYFNHSTLSELPTESTVFYDSTNQLPNEDIGMTIVDKNTTIVSFDLSNKWVGIVYINEQYFQRFTELCLDRSKNRLFLFEIINNMINNEYDFVAHQPTNMKIIKVDNPQSLANCKEKFYL